MIQATLTKITYVHDLRLGTHMPEAVTFELPNGLEFHVGATDELLKYIQDVAQDATQDAGPEPAPVAPEPARAAPQEVDEENTMVEWMHLPEETLALNYKLALQSLGNINPVIQLHLLRNLVDAIDREFTDENWATVLGTPTAASMEQAGKLIPASVDSPGGPRVSVDDHGNPYVAAQDEPDPGERTAADDDDDDDGARQF